MTSRVERRKAATRRKLIDAARTLLAREGAQQSSIQEITEAADVGFGSFYNHFESKAELFQVAIADVLEEIGQTLDRIRADIDDPAEAFTLSVRVTARAVRANPQIARVVDQYGLSYLDSEYGLAPRALADIRAAVDAGRFHLVDPYLALASTGGSLLALLHLWLARPGLVGDTAWDDLAEQLLRSFGMDPAEARAIATRPLPQA
ncbi:TetR/AcrR family transcriptional regulator [Nonomuraea sp. NPDC046570]|uniref:TetR/AcrR family transcriptional regulator n=1 Tax=Nonomuraea sp. NPDC046570 TaxID=3155255 RepID=UPI003405FD8B